jgi:hypothetical protein
MVDRSDYLLPRYLGTPFRDKPILYFAVQAASLRLFGMNEAAIRIPGFLFALFGCVTTAILARRLFDPETAVYAVLASLTLVLPIALAQSATHDIALVPWINLLVLCFWEQDQTTHERQRWGWTAGAAVCVALALLTKGLIGIAIVSSGIAIFLILTHSLSWAMLGRCVVTLLAGGLLASPWFMAMESASSGYLFYYFVERHFLGFVTKRQEHGNVAWHYYLVPVLGGSMPWLLYAAATVLQARSDVPKARSNRAILLLVCWFLGGFVFLNGAGSKLLTYSLPLFPPIAVLAGFGFRRFFHNDISPMVQRVFVTVFRLCSIFGMIAPVIALLVIQRSWGITSPPAAYVVAILASTVMGVAFVLFERSRSRTSFAIGMLWFPISFVCLMSWPVQVLAEQYSQRSLAREVRSASSRPDQLLIVGERVGSLMFYLSTSERMWFRAGRAREASLNEFAGLNPIPSDTFVAVSEKKMRSYDRAQEILQTKPIRAGKFFVIGTPTKRPMVAERPNQGGK